MWIKNHSKWDSLFLDLSPGTCGPLTSLPGSNCMSCNGKNQHQGPSQHDISCKKGNDKQPWNRWEKLAYFQLEETLS